MKWLYEKLATKFAAENLVYSETEYTPIEEAIRLNATQDSLVLLKGSRGMKLETILKAFQ